MNATLAEPERSSFQHKPEVATPRGSNKILKPN
jgi:hypothetical protein